MVSAGQIRRSLAAAKRHPRRRPPPPPRPPTTTTATSTTTINAYAETSAALTNSSATPTTTARPGATGSAASVAVGSHNGGPWHLRPPLLSCSVWPRQQLKLQLEVAEMVENEVEAAHHLMEEAMKTLEQEQRALAERQENAVAKAAGLPLPHPNPWEAVEPRLDPNASREERMRWHAEFARKHAPRR